ncbi:MAG TPA: hypothetical protein VFX70_05360 [Mycobacteriales bacterium]|nr:hypothetical protein [Mycobacteriales bacterium]
MAEQTSDSVDEEADGLRAGVLDEVVPPPSKTPLFQAINSARYQRQALIRDIQETMGTKLICYVAGIAAPVDREDVVCFVDLLHNISHGQSIDLLLQTGGGDIDAAEKLMAMVRKKAETGQVRIIVPNYAKSAGTLMALGADCIIMSDTSELGSIDPQIVRSDHNGNRVRHSVKNYIDAYKANKQALVDNPNDVAAQLMMSKLDPETVQLFESIMTRAREFAENQLKRGMMSGGGNWSQAVNVLLNTTRFQTHGQPISWEDASDPAIGLTVDYLDPNDGLWLQIWQLYCLQMLSVKDNEKLFESEIASLCIESSTI